MTFVDFVCLFNERTTNSSQVTITDQKGTFSARHALLYSSHSLSVLLSSMVLFTDRKLQPNIFNVISSNNMDVPPTLQVILNWDYRLLCAY